jgi:hypothetical protein
MLDVSSFHGIGRRRGNNEWYEILWFLFVYVSCWFGASSTQWIWPRPPRRTARPAGPDHSCRAPGSGALASHRRAVTGRRNTAVDTSAESKKTTQIKTNRCANQGRIMQNKPNVWLMPIFTQMREFEQAAHAPNQQRSSTGKANCQQVRKCTRIIAAWALTDTKFYF